MTDLELVITIADRERIDEYVRLYGSETVHMALIFLGRGTASGEMLEYLGLEVSEKAVILTVTPYAKELIKDFRRRLGLDVPGNGLVLSVPLSSIGGMNAVRDLTGDDYVKAGDEDKMSKAEYELIFVIATAGCSDIVMEAARPAGAGGGTVIHAKGTGAAYAGKFFGLSIADEKEIVLIVVKAADKNNVMRAVMTGAGADTKAKSIVFSLPVSAVSGLRFPGESEEL